MQTIKQTILTVIICMVVVAGVSVVFAWTGAPPSGPPNDNTLAPINISATQQIKSGPLQVNGFRNLGTTILDGKVGIGTTAPDPRAKLEVNGNVYAGSGESHFWYGTYSDPHENVPYAIKVAGSGGVGSIAASGNAVFMNGNVGIGTTGPKSLLHIKSDSPSVNAMINLESDLGIVNQIYTGRSAGGAPGHLVIEPATGKNTIINNGNVGIGTTVDPGTNKLQVNGKIQAIGGDICTDQGGGKCLSAAGGGTLSCTTVICYMTGGYTGTCAAATCSAGYTVTGCGANVSNSGSDASVFFSGNGCSINLPSDIGASVQARCCKIQ